MKCFIQPYDGDEPYIFVSFCHKDEANVYPMIERLVVDGYRVWFDDGLHPGDDWPDVIAEHLYNSTTCLIVASSAYVQSSNCKNEMTFAINYNKPIVSVILEKFNMPNGLKMQICRSFSLNYYEFLPNGEVNVEPIIMKEESYEKLEKNLLMFYIGAEHQASVILSEQSKNLGSADKFEAQKKMCAITRELKKELQNNNVDALGRCLHENWLLKKSLASGISNPLIDEVYEKAINAGALGGKLLGAGGAGFMLFYVPEAKQESVRKALSDLREMEFEMDNSGASIIHFDR